MRLRTKLLVGALIAVSSSQVQGSDAKLLPDAIEKLTGLSGKLNEKENVFKVSQPRADVKVAVDQWTMPPFMGLTSWAAFTPGRKQDLMVMGDLVLFQDEVNSVMSAVLNNGLEVTALHNHFFYDEPKVYFMHIAGEGKLETLASGVRKALEKVKEVRGKNPVPTKSFLAQGLPSKNSVTPKPIEDVIGSSGQAQDGMYKIIIGKKAKMDCGCAVGKEMGVNTWAAFAGSDENSIVDGDFAVREHELQPVLKSLRSSGVNIVAIHHHMTGESPRILFLHYWGRGKAIELARAVKAALIAQENSKEE
ncbi:MAG: DUF1259 domain-containing protein [Bdellovibrionales bacterium]|nr:DUF1259 domain-containing protein [Bdellovibrionales bacterium]